MRILTLEIEGIKRVKVASITPPKGDDVVLIAGKNGAGKTSILDGMWWALAGTKAHQSEPIRRGQKKARIRLDCGDVIVTRTFGRSKPRKEGAPSRITTGITVENADGAVYRSPQAMLNGMMDSLAFDPLDFANQKPAEKYETLKGVCGLDFDDKLKANADDYTKRRRFNREAKSNRFAAERISIADDAPTERVSVSGLVAELGDARIANARDAEELAERKRMAAKTEALRAEAAENSTEAARLRERANRLDEDSRLLIIDAELKEKALAAMPAIPDPIDTLAIEARIADAGGINRAVANRERRDGYTAKAEEAAKSSKECDDRMDRRNTEIREAIEAADMPVDGLSLADGKVTFDGFPFEQASDAVQLEVSCAIAMRNNAKLRVIRIRNGSLLDSDSLAAIRKAAGERDYQVWIEVVEEDRTVGFYIEEGEVVARPETPDESETPEAPEEADTKQEGLFDAKG